ncbi:MAG: hypothetical protein L0271_06065, partial [Gemmatimonadetes bacterium]|nr:hypothetical protein [Gemmatimonadota bacterium]
VATGITIDAWTAAPDWHGERLDAGFAVLTLRRPRRVQPAGATQRDGGRPLASPQPLRVHDGAS